MGFSWSFYLVQEFVVHLCKEPGIDQKSILVSEWPAPDIKAGVISRIVTTSICLD